jgi:hypothetical protein
MREQLNSNPILQLAVIGVLLLGGGFFAMSTMGGGESEADSSETAVTATVNGATATGATPGAAVEGAVEGLEASAAAATVPPTGVVGDAPARLPRPVLRAWKHNQTVVLLFVRDGGIDDRLVARTTKGLSSLPRVTGFVVPASKIARYTAVSEGVGVERVPALVVISPRHLDQQVPTASVHYGFQSVASVSQAIVDAGYKGPTLDYHP